MDIYKQIEELRKAEDNWDGYDAAAPKKHLIDLACKVIEHVKRKPDYAHPTRTGGVLLIWAKPVSDSAYMPETEMDIGENVISIIHEGKVSTLGFGQPEFVGSFLTLIGD